MNLPDGLLERDGDYELPPPPKATQKIAAPPPAVRKKARVGMVQETLFGI